MKPDRMTKADLLEQHQSDQKKINALETAHEDVRAQLRDRIGVLRARAVDDPTLLAIHGCIEAIRGAPQRATKPETPQRSRSTGAYLGEASWGMSPSVVVSDVLAYLEREFADVIADEQKQDTCSCGHH